MTTLLVIGLIVTAFLLGRVVQWINDAKNIMGDRSGRRHRP